MKLRSAVETDRPKAKALRTTTGTDSIAGRRLRLKIHVEDMCGKVSVVNGQVLKRVEQNTLEGRVSLSSGSSFVLLFDDRRSHWYPFHRKRKQHCSVMEDSFLLLRKAPLIEDCDSHDHVLEAMPPPLFFNRSPAARGQIPDLKRLSLRAGREALAEQTQPRLQKMIKSR